MIRFEGISDIGLKRKDNQDYFVCDYNDDGEFLAIVCDGVAGGPGGSIASQTIATTLMGYFKENPNFTKANLTKKWIADACQQANNVLRSIAKQNPLLNNMATTLVGVLISKVGTFVFNIGDSRVYSLYDKLVCLTQDHQCVRYEQEKGKTKPVKKVYLSNFLGIYDVIDVDIIKIKDNYKRILLCTDGLHNSISDQLMYECFMMKEPLKNICERFVEIAKQNGGHDNITAVMIERNLRYGKIN